MRTRFLIAVMAVLAVACFARAASTDDNPDDVYWDNSIRPTNPRVVGTVNAIVDYNGLTIVGGSFFVSGVESGNNIAAWYGSSWSALGSGTDSAVLTLSVYDGKLIAGGAFTYAGGIASNHIAAWNGSDWVALGEGANASVEATAVFNGKLIVGGGFSSAGGVSANHAASWDGSVWSPLATGTYGSVKAFAELNGKVMVGWTGGTWLPWADSSGISIWDGSAFTNEISLGKDIRIPPGGLGVYRDQLVVSVLHTGCADWGCAVGILGFWEQDHWTMSTETEGGGALAVWGDRLIAIGSTGYWGGQVGEVNKLSAWNGDSWTGLIDASDLNDFNALGTSSDELFVGGRFGTGNIATWNGVNWLSVGTDLQNPFQDLSISALAVYNNKVIVGHCIPAGEFQKDGSASLITAWDGTSWASLGYADKYPIAAFAVFDNKLIAAGSFDSMGGVAARGIAAWDGTEWSPLASGVNRIVNCLAIYKGKLVAGGWFFGEEGSTADHIVAWDGSSWTSLGAGINGYSEVYALTVFDDKLIVGGRFDAAGGNPARNIAAWNGTSWLPLGAGIDDWVHDLVVYDNALFASTGDSILTWDGTSWSPFGAGAPDGISAMTVYDGRLIASGRFDSAGGVSCKNIAAWDGRSWSALGSGLRRGINYWTPIPQGSALSVYNDKLVVGGYFNTAGNKSALNLAMWTKHMRRNVWHVATDGSDETGDGSEQYPFATIQHGVDSASTGNTVLVGPGTYTGPGNRDIDFNGKDIVLMSTDGPEVTIIDCESQGRGFYLHSGETRAAKVQGFTITHGLVYGDDYPSGGGICCVNADPTIEGNIITFNRAGWGCFPGTGGGISCLSASPLITENVIAHNTSQWQINCGPGTELINFDGRGGGIALYGSTAVLTNNTIVANEVPGPGGFPFYGWCSLSGGILAIGSAFTIQNCIIAFNRFNAISSSGVGGPVITACDFYGNVYTSGSGWDCYSDQANVRGNYLPIRCFAIPSVATITCLEIPPVRRRTTLGMGH